MYVHPNNKPIGEDVGASIKLNPKAEPGIDPPSPQQTEEFYDTLASVHDNLSHGVPKTTKSLEQRGEEHATLDVDTIPTEERGQLTVV